MNRKKRIGIKVKWLLKDGAERDFLQLSGDCVCVCVCVFLG